MILTLESKHKYRYKRNDMTLMNKKLILAHIVATSSNNTIGWNNQLPWSIPKDLQFFKEKTKHHIVIMGRKTFQSLGKALPYRTNMVVSKNKNFQPADAQVYSTTHTAIEDARKKSQKKEIFIIGGGEIYKQTMGIVDKIYMTRIHQNYQGDAFYPSLPENQFHLTHQEDHSGNPAFSFLTYERKTPATKEF